jgi:hypothetical protein
MKAVDNSSLERWRSIDATTVLERIAEHAKRDVTYVPAKNASSTRWHATVAGHNFELLLTGPKFWDTTAKQGGGGAIDLVMHVQRRSFKEAVAHITMLGL